MLTNFSYYLKATEPELAANVFFEEMDGSPAQKTEWQTNRLNIYGGSAMNFFRSLINDGSIRAGFTLFKTVGDSISNGKKLKDEALPVKFKALRNLQIHDMVKKTVIKGRFAFISQDSLYVTFRKDKDEKWGNSRMAELLPADYEP